VKIIRATPKKLNDGSWGATAKSASAQAGDMLDVVDTDGMKYSAMVDRVVFRGQDSAVCAIAAPDSKRSSEVPDQCPACDGWLRDSDLLEADVAGYHVECC